MVCSKCGSQNAVGQKFCNNCGNQLQEVAPEAVNPTPQVVTSDPQKPAKTSKGVKFLAIIGGVFVGFIVLIVAIIGITSATSNKLVCKSDEGNITIMYNDKTLTGYSANGIVYDLDGQKAIAENIGVDAYLTQFEVWFDTNTTGKCTRNE